MRIRSAIVIVALLFVLPFAFRAAQSEQEPTSLELVLSDVPWLALEDVETVRVDGEQVLTVSYVSAEFDLVAYRAEMLEVFRVVGAALPDDVDAVTLVPMADMGFGLQGIEAATAPAALLPGYAAGEMTRTQLLEDVDIIPLEHGSDENAERSPA